MSTLERLSRGLLLVLVFSLPFELRIIPVFSNLQWVFIALAAVSLPLLWNDRKKLLIDRFVVLAFVFVLSQWLTALMADQFMTNALKAAGRVSAGLLLACIVLRQPDKTAIVKAWCVASVGAAVYGLLDFWGMGAFELFREVQQFYYGDRVRLSGSFEYPTTAAAYFAVSLPLMALRPMSLPVRLAGSTLLWCVLLLTYSRGAAIAGAAVLLCAIGISRWRLAVSVAAAGVALFAIVAFFEPTLIGRFGGVGSGKGYSAEYTIEHNRIIQKPRAQDASIVSLKNTGLETWRASGDDAVTLSYYWYDTVNRRIVEVPAIETSLPHDVRPNASVTLSAPFRTPGEPGSYLLDWDLVHKNRGLFSTQYRVIVGVVEAEIDENAVVWKGTVDTRHWVKRGPDVKPSLDSTVSRSDLWQAAIELFQGSPLVGEGPDSFRLLYGRQLGFEEWDTRIRSNSLYLELLAGSGVIGLFAFIAMLRPVHWTLRPAPMALAVFLLHGVVDVFLMTTPIYFGFWILMGLTRETS